MMTLDPINYHSSVNISSMQHILFVITPPTHTHTCTYQLMKVNCCVLSFSQDRVPVWSALLSMETKNTNKQKVFCGENAPSAITAFVPPHCIWATQQLLYSARSIVFFSCCDQCVPITQSDRDGVRHVRVAMDYHRSYIDIYSIYLCSGSVACYLWFVLAWTPLYRFAQYKVVIKKNSWIT